MKNILENPPMNKTNIPIWNRPLIIHISPFFLMLIQNQRKTKQDNNKYKIYDHLFREDLINLPL